MPFYLPPSHLDLQTLHQEVDQAPEEDQTVESFLKKYVFSAKVEPIFVHQSHSVQFGDTSFPRVLLVTQDRRLTISFAGKIGSEGWETLEVMDVNPSRTPRFEFAEIVFPKNLSQAQHPLWNGYGPVESRCGSCHDGGGGPDALNPVIPISSTQRDQGVWGGLPAPWPEDLGSSWTAFSADFQPTSRYAPLRAWIDGATEEKISNLTQDYLSKLKSWTHGLR